MQSLNRALDLIEIIAERGGIGVRELSKTAGLPPASTHRIVAALVARGYLNKDGRSHHYTLSPKFLILGETVQQQIDIVSIARPFLEKLMTKTRESTNLCVRDGHNVIYIDHVGSPDHHLRAFTKLGGSAPLYASGVGKIFLSGFNREQLEHYLDRVVLQAFTPHTITAVSRLIEELNTIRRKGYAVDNQEKEIGVRCVAAPIINHIGQVQAAISISGAAQRLTVKRLPALSRLVVDTSRQLSTAIGHRRS